jgi:hypothetical protein
MACSATKIGIPQVVRLLNRQGQSADKMAATPNRTPTGLMTLDTRCALRGDQLGGG